MGHTRLGVLPKTHRWPEVVALFHSQTPVVGPEANVGTAAAKVLDITETGLSRAANDPGLAFTFLTLARLASAARSGSLTEELPGLKGGLPAKPSAFALTAEFHNAIDAYVDKAPGGRTDVAEIAQAAAGEALLRCIQSSGNDLFGESEDATANLSTLANRKGFGELSRLFFARFTARYLNFYLSKATATATGQGTITRVEDITAFNKALDLHAHQTAKIVESFAGHWFSKAEYRQELDLAHTKRFLAIALQKIRKEIDQQKVRG